MAALSLFNVSFVLSELEPYTQHSLSIPKNVL